MTTRALPRDNDGASEPVECPMRTSIASNSYALDVLHGRMREHDAKIAALTSQSKHTVERLARVEGSTSDHHRLLVTLETHVSGVESLVKNVIATTRATHDLLEHHIHDNLSSYERVTRRLVKIAGLIGAVLVLLALIHSAMTGQTIWSTVGGWL